MKRFFQGKSVRLLPELRYACAAVAISAALTIGSPVLASPATPSMASLTTQQKADLSKMLTTELQQVVNKQKRLPGQKVQPISVRLDSQTSTVMIEMGRDFIPKGDKYISGDVEEQLHQLEVVAFQIVGDSFVVEGTTFTFGGVPGDKLFAPTKWKPEHLRNKTTVNPSADADSPVVVSAGHGRTKVTGGWGWQRPAMNGWHEDVDNPTLASKLAEFLRTRSDETITFPRSTSATIEGQTKLPWWQLAAKYHLARILPNETNIWNSPDVTSEKDKDVHSRPRYARYLNAKAIISLHTDAADDTTVRGTRVIYQTGSTPSQELATAISCSMKEIINATTGYETWRVNTPTAGNYGENREAIEVPANIIEVGFHSNPQDAAAFRDTVFQEAAMKGIEKGYRVNRDGKTCVPQKITSVPKAVANLNGPKLQVPITFIGNPQFPVKRVRKITNCPAGWTCPDDVFTYEQEQTTPFNTTWWCNGPTDTKTQVVDVLVTLEDADGVKSEFKTNFTCKAA
ncbi:MULTISPECIES: N-acetylmuramoyl-L-alanine amidase [Xanthomonas]|uniref:N-acetylmuramoyl-L-alanine amidase n=1 Tax=Xanthomonas dyei TaxID=743699 RepID=A0ABZ0DHK5_9XANT|nr:N-acetylmuramoyl-L-alanine amidase [Xanthomonas dyei]MCC4631856.1 N-acetylmuramoyl-L-alanine amidase [Xanthomonas dyei pv. eucalypti]WOB27695.1 N-acetylmuramoyl-L-alanine amidase [Xanthomonas dyei]WOB55317.1 N-acetylmuramoyl-L-alanine amidase [Xanthomonas dyei]